MSATGHLLEKIHRVLWEKQIVRRENVKHDTVSNKTYIWRTLQC